MRRSLNYLHVAGYNLHLIPIVNFAAVCVLQWQSFRLVAKLQFRL
jgi:hypothetical protein